MQSTGESCLLVANELTSRSLDNSLFPLLSIWKNDLCLGKKSVAVVKKNFCFSNRCKCLFIVTIIHNSLGRKYWRVNVEIFPHLINSRYIRLTSSLQETVASPWAFLALQVYTPPSKLQGFRISREQMPWLEIWRYLGSSPMTIWFFNHSILGWDERKMYKIN